MRPLQLTMQSFGPYKDRETIDFTALADCRLFVISGNTGAGKTTIFDAVCFALYGKASGEDRKDPRMLRSHFADDETHTSVELAFAVGSRTYRVFRQMPHRKAGNKSETGGRIELYETTGGREVPCDSRFTTDDVNRRLERIVGLTLEQFSQIVMLPQGEFRKLLTSETDDKEKILRRIFRTELYNRTEELFQEKTREQRALLQQERTALDVHVQQVAVALPRRDDSELFRTLDAPYRQAPQVVAALEEEGAHYAAQREELQQRRERLAQQATEREAAYHAAKALNERLALQERKREEQALLASRKPAMEAAEARQREAEQAARIEPYEERRRAAAAYTAEKREQREAKLADAAAAAQAAELAERRYDEEAAREPERAAAARELERLGELAPAVRALAVREREAERIAGEERELAAGAAALERELEGALAAKRQLGERIRQAERDTAALPERKERLLKLRQQAKLLKDLLELERRLGEGAKLEAARSDAALRAKEEHDRLERSWVDNQAALLAAHLHDGAPCPVCGSADHPRKASAGGDAVSREALQEAKERLLRHEREYQEAKAQAAATRSGWEGKRGELAELEPAAAPDEGDVQPEYERLVAEGTRLKATVDKLEELAAELLRWKRDAEERERAAETLAAEKDKRTARLQEARMQLHTQRALLEQELARIPEALRAPDRLDAALQAQRQLAAKLTAAWSDAQERRQSARTKLAEERAHANQLEAQLAEAETQLAEAAARFAAELAAAGFASAQQFAAAQLPPAERQRLAAELAAFREAQAALAAQLAELASELASAQPADLAALAAELAQLRAGLDAAAAEAQRAESLCRDSARLAAGIAAAHERTAQAEARLSLLQDVFQALKGDNSLKLSFERYILIEFLEQILQAANHRLRKLSNGQFELQRSGRLETRGKQSGLGLDVYDAYTGMNRDVKSMSGGEKFNASLCLALGMSDVIQAYEGGVSIEMMFIDEGFGSLDEESLAKAIDTLVDLQRSGRMIGVISHVQELKAALPAAIEVTKTKDGHSRTAVVLK